jgi:hypothetical protein
MKTNCLAYLENLFLHSDEVKKELPEQAKQFVFIDQEVKRILKDAHAKQYTSTSVSNVAM